MPASTMTFRGKVILAACLLALAVSPVLAPPAKATSQDLRYSCSYAFTGAQGTVDAVARFDSSIEEDGPLKVGVSVSNVEWRGSVTFPTEFTADLAAVRIDSLGGEGLLFLFLDGHKSETDVGLVFRGERPDEPGPTVIYTDGEFGLVDSGRPGAHVIQAGDFIADLEDDGVDKETLHCALVDPGDITVDTFVVGAPTPTPTPSPTTAPEAPTPVRPVIVQTDEAQHTSASSWPVFANALPLMPLGGDPEVAGPSPRWGSMTSR